MKSDLILFFRVFVICVIILLVIVGALNFLIDPFNIYPSPEMQGLNVVKPELETHWRIFKAYDIFYIKPQSICLGSSRVVMGVDPSHIGWEAKPVYNAGMPGATMYEMLRYFQHANNIYPLKQVLLCLDYFPAGLKISRHRMSDFSEMRLSIGSDGNHNPFFLFEDAGRTLFSLDACYSTAKTVAAQPAVKELINKLPGFASIGQQISAGYRKTNNAFERTLYQVYANEASIVADKNITESAYDYYREILQIAHRDNIDLRLFTSPCHARMWEIFGILDLLPQNEDWKRNLVKINEEEAIRYGKQPFPIWDFSVYNEYTTENLPPLEDKVTVMRWHYDTSHFNKDFGNLIQDQIFNKSGSPAPISNFGTLINTGNIESHLQKIRMDRQNYRDTHPQDIEEIEQLAK